MYVIQYPPLELLMLNKHNIIALREIPNSDFEELYEIDKVNENTLMDYEVVCYTCNKYLLIYDPITASLRKPTEEENKNFIIK